MSSSVAPVTVALPTLGCKVNQYDSAQLALALRARGYQIVAPHQPADVYIVHTCTVTREAEGKSRKTLRRALRCNSAALLIVTGCYATLASEELAALEGVDAVVPIQEHARISDLLVQLRPPTTPAVSASVPRARTRATVKIQDGCNLRCTFCAVTLARGELRSRPLEELLDELQALAARGVPEIVLTGIRTDAYGLERPGPRLADLLDATHALPVARLRISSLEPLGINARLVASLAAHPRLCHHFHVCLQSGDDGVLRAMRRGYTTARFRQAMARLRAAMPDATFSTDVIVGFPGETEAAFARTCALIEELGLFKLHVFPFSARPGTVAATLPDALPAPVVAARIGALHALEATLFARVATGFLGQVQPVLVERTGPQGDGLLPHYLRVQAAFPAGTAGRVLPVHLHAVGDGFLHGMVTVA
jgi:threonylcarbamoyladenosine tRNA methylthiotransferase MtaB